MKSHGKGRMGELAVRKSLIAQGYKVYIPEVDNEQVDLIVEQDNGQFRRVQVKTVSKEKTGTSIEVNMTKYQKTGRVDVVAVYYAPKDMIAYVPYETRTRSIWHSPQARITSGKAGTGFTNMKDFRSFRERPLRRQYSIR